MIGRWWRPSIPTPREQGKMVGPFTLCRESDPGIEAPDEPISTVTACQFAFHVSQHGRYRLVHGERWRCILVRTIDGQTECRHSR